MSLKNINVIMITDMSAYMYLMNVFYLLFEFN
jgi:hypothetical protein